MPPLWKFVTLSICLSMFRVNASKAGFMGQAGVAPGVSDALCLSGLHKSLWCMWMRFGVLETQIRVAVMKRGGCLS